LCSPSPGKEPLREGGDEGDFNEQPENSLNCSDSDRSIIGRQTSSEEDATAK
jgi:hypothetical protein